MFTNMVTKLSMNLKEYLEKNSINRKCFAVTVGVSSGQIDQLCFGRKPSPKLARRIELATGGAVSRMEQLYPDEHGAAA